MKRKLLLSILAMVPAAIMPLAAACQDSQSGAVAPIERPEISYKYEVYAGYGYTSLNQLNQSRYGLQGVNVSITRDFGKYFGITADGAFYVTPIAAGNPGNPKVYAILAGPVLHAPLFGHYSAFIHVLLGGEHTGGEGMSPNISFAGGMGGGLEYQLRPHLALRASGDNIGAAFTLAGNTPGLAYSPHTTWNSRATIGVVYKF